MPYLIHTKQEKILIFNAHALSMKSIAVKVPKEEGERIRRELLDKGVLRRGLVIRRDSEFIYFPVSRRIEGYELAEMEFRERERKVNYRDLVCIPSEMKVLLPTSFDVVGDILILRLDDALIPYKDEVGNALLAVNKNVRVVALDKGVKGPFRIRDLEIIVGEKRTETLHREYSLRFKLDLSKVYFSPRLATEHYRVASQVRENEIVIDMFSGVGPFSLMIAKLRRPEKVYAIDINPSAIEYLKENIELNKVGKIVPILGDARGLIENLEKADRVIMNLPHSAYEFFDVVLDKIKKDGIIHYYEMVEEDKISERIEYLKARGSEKGFELDVVEERRVRTYSPKETNVALDLRLRSAT